MKIHFLRNAILFLIIITVPLYSYSQYQDLFRIVENGKTGYINSKGAIIIPPKYINGGDFMDGLAPVRLNGLYGYINDRDSFVIQPGFDYAYGFFKGIASVYKNGRQYIIDKNNRQFLDNVYKGGYFSNYNHAIVITKSEHYGVMDLRAKKLIVDTVYDRIDNFQKGAARVKRKVYKKDSTNQYDFSWSYGVIDSLGKVLVPFGKYEEIGDYVNGISVVTFKKDSLGYPTSQGAINERGELLFRKVTGRDLYLSDAFYNGLAILHFNRYSNKACDGYINLKGAVVFKDSLAPELKEFSCGRAFVPDHAGGLRMIDNNCKFVVADTFKTCLNNGFVNNYAIVRKAGIGWGIVDTNGRFTEIEWKYDYDKADHKAETMVMGRFLFFNTEDPKDESVAGIMNLSGEEIVPPVMQYYDEGGFKNGLLKAVVNNRLTYIDTFGNMVWQEKRMPDKTLKTYDIDYMNRGYFYAHSKPHKDDLGGYGGSGNTPKLITETDLFAPDRLSVLVRPDETDSIDVDEEDYYKAITVYVSNTTEGDIEFDAQDSRLYMTVQARDASGIWKSIEYSPSSWCGNSYHILTLDKNNYWKFLTPVYSGSFRTKFRIELKYIAPRSSGDKKTLTVYSNEYDGSINPAQFWRKLNYRSGGIMDPYDD